MKKIFYLILLLICVGCSNSNIIVPEQKSALTVGIIKKEVIKGQTTQNDILSLFGAPNIITTNAQGNEVWNYNKSSYQTGTETKGSAWGLFLVGGSSKNSVLSNSSTTSMDFIVIFNSKGIVEDYKVISSAF